MSVQLLDKTRKIGKLLHNNHSSKVKFNDICQVLTEILDSCVLVLSRKGKVLGVSYNERGDDLSELISDLSLIHILGYLSSEVREARDRVRTALKNCGYRLPVKRITVNLSPANIRKSGSGFDLPVAISLLAAMGEVPKEPLGEVMLAGELSLDGKVNGVPGVLPMALAARDFGMKYMILPKENRREGELVPGITTVAVSCLLYTSLAATRPSSGSRPTPICRIPRFFTIIFRESCWSARAEESTCSSATMISCTLCAECRTIWRAAWWSSPTRCAGRVSGTASVSYTHLDVYKRQGQRSIERRVLLHGFVVEAGIVVKAVHGGCVCGMGIQIFHQVHHHEMHHGNPDKQLFFVSVILHHRRGHPPFPRNGLFSSGKTVPT